MKGYRPHKPKQKESSIDEAVRAYGISQGCETIKLTTLNRYGTVGHPDRLWLLPGGRIFFMEMKAPGKVCTPRQLEAHKRLRKLGLRVYVCDNTTAGRAVIDAELSHRGWDQDKV